MTKKETTISVRLDDETLESLDSLVLLVRNSSPYTREMSRAGLIRAIIRQHLSHPKQ